jgi:hypothetical protein
VIPASVALPVAVGVLVAYFLLRKVAARPRAVAPGPPTPELRDEPPAVVNLLVNRLVDAPQAASATLLDLAAKRIVEIHEVADGAEHTLVRLRRPDLPGDRPAYERRVADRVRHVAGARLTPVAELVKRYAEGGDLWRRRVARDAVLDARRRGLTRPSGRSGLALVTSGLATAGLLAPLVPAPDAQLFGVAVVGLAMLWFVLFPIGAGLLFTSIRERPTELDRLTPLGYQATAHWLGVAAWLRAHEPLRDLPPAAVAIWDRYLAYGVALDTMPHAVRVLDFETVGHRDVLRSEHTGQPREAHVSYRRDWLMHPLGPVPARASLLWAAVTLPVWLGAGIWLAGAVSSTGLRAVVVVLAAGQLGRTGYRLVRAILDLARPVQVTGTIIDIGLAGRLNTADYVEMMDLPTHYFVVVDDDDNPSDLLRPWIVNRDIARGHPLQPNSLTDVESVERELGRLGFGVGDRVRLVGQRRSRYVTSMERLQPAAYRVPWQPPSGS